MLLPLADVIQSQRPMVRRSARLSSAAGQKRRRRDSSPREQQQQSARPQTAATTKRRRNAATGSSNSTENASEASSPSPSSSSSFSPSSPLAAVVTNGTVTTATATTTTTPPSSARAHSASYHRPLLLDGADHRRALLVWFDSVSGARGMPWRKPWMAPGGDDDGDGDGRAALETRAYEVWISEVMLQQTRVAVVVDYWKRWMARWPTMRHLAAAEADDVLAAWRGLGYYSRATRILQAARLVVDDADMSGLLPADPAVLAARVPGIGRYTAGAISAIVFGRPEPMVDGNVLRVLSRQLGIYADVKTNRAVIDAVWAAADALVKIVAADDDDDGPPRPSDRPGRWGQALMELGSTVCTPKPDCSACPITATCRVYQEAEALVSGKSDQAADLDMEDVCQLCLPFEQHHDHGPSPSASSQRRQPKGRRGPSPATNVADYARRFPPKATKKAVAEEQRVVCAVRRGDGRYLIQRRPATGLLAGLWELPSALVSSRAAASAAARARLARAHAASLLEELGTGSRGLAHVGELGTVPWLFSHLKSTMHVHLFVCEEAGERGQQQVVERRWSGDVEAESMGTGMRKCWALVRREGDEAV